MAAAARRTSPGEWSATLVVLREIDELTGGLVPADKYERLRSLIAEARTAVREASTFLNDDQAEDGIISLLDDFVADAETYVGFVQHGPSPQSPSQSRQKADAARVFWKAMRASFRKLHRVIQNLAL